MPADFKELPATSSLPTTPVSETVAAEAAPAAALATSPRRRRRERLGTAVATVTATRLLPLVALLDALQPTLDQESVFRTRRKKLKAHWVAAYAELRAEYPRHQVLAHAFQALAELLREEVQDINPEEWKQAARELALATLQNAPALLNAAHQARLLR